MNDSDFYYFSFNTEGITFETGKFFTQVLCSLLWTCTYLFRYGRIPCLLLKFLSILGHKYKRVSDYSLIHQELF